MYNRHVGRLDTHFRKLCRSIVGPPPGTVWTLEWHEILHQLALFGCGHRTVNLCFPASDLRPMQFQFERSKFCVLHGVVFAAFAAEVTVDDKTA